MIIKKIFNKIKLCWNLLWSSDYTVFGTSCFGTSYDSLEYPIGPPAKSYYAKERSDGSFDIMGTITWITSDLKTHYLHIVVANFKGENAGACCDILLDELNHKTFPNNGDAEEKKFPKNYIMYVND